jgi:SAM-dependent methyltransferase
MGHVDRTAALRWRIRSIPVIGWVAPRAFRFVTPSRRREDAQSRRLNDVFNFTTVQTGPFAGMRLVGTSHPVVQLGCYEAELHPLIESWSGYDRIVDVGCGQGWYTTGLALRMPGADIYGFDIDPVARSRSRETAEANGVKVTIGEAIMAEQIGALVEGRTLVIMDVEGAELELLDPSVGLGLSRADILVEMHDFIRKGATETILARFPARTPTVIEQTPRDPSQYPVLARLDPADQQRAISDQRPGDQHWLWLPL